MSIPCTPIEDSVYFEGWPFVRPDCGACGDCISSTLQVRSRVKAGFSQWCCYNVVTTTLYVYKTACHLEAQTTCERVFSEIRPGDDVLTAGFEGFGDTTCPDIETTDLPDPPCEPPPGSVLCSTTPTTVYSCPDFETQLEVLFDAAVEAATWGGWSEWEDVVEYTPNGVPEVEGVEELVANTSYTTGAWGSAVIELRVIGPVPIKLIFRRDGVSGTSDEVVVVTPGSEVTIDAGVGSLEGGETVQAVCATTLALNPA